MHWFTVRSIPFCVSNSLWCISYPLELLLYSHWDGCGGRTWCYESVGPSWFCDWVLHVVFLCTCLMGIDAWPRWAAYTGRSLANFITRFVRGKSERTAQSIVLSTLCWVLFYKELWPVFVLHLPCDPECLLAVICCRRSVVQSPVHSYFVTLWVVNDVVEFWL